MTAEIAVLNRNAVALAADSAVTLQLPEGPKIYQTNKLFTLSKHRPVGIMIYGSADLMDVPWETVVKMYRSRLGDRSYARLKGYAEDFLRYLEKSPRLFPPDRQELFCGRLAAGWLRVLKGKLKREITEKLRLDGPVSPRDVRQVFRNLLERELADLRRARVLPRFAKTSAQSLRRRYAEAIRRAIREELGSLSSAIPTERLERACADLLRRMWQLHNGSGIVIAGFGEEEFLPRLYAYQLDSVVGGRLRVSEDRRKRCHIDTGSLTAAVVAFAQSEMVSLFMNGIDADYSAFMRRFVSHSMIDGYPGLVAKLIGDSMPARKKNLLIGKLRQSGATLASELESARAQYQQEHHSNPIVEIVNHLPKEELAAMAEALVSLTSFKRHITRNPETVGGPVDVAVISRGDGFVWIRRKHYFERRLNEQFFANYFSANTTGNRGRK